MTIGALGRMARSETGFFAVIGFEVCLCDVQMAFSAVLQGLLPEVVPVNAHDIVRRMTVAANGKFLIGFRYQGAMDAG